MDVDLVVFDNELSPSQLRQITETVGRKVLDRDAVDPGHLRGTGTAPARASCRLNWRS
jgi:hypothetical protein